MLASLDGVSVAFDGNPALTDIDLEIRAGEIVTLAGPNGSGKSTLLKIVLGLIKPDRGRVRRRPGLCLGYVPQRLVVDHALPMTVERFLLLAGRAARRRMGAVIGELGLDDLVARPIQEISGGQFQRVLLARALVRDPDLLLLDEPVQGVDIAGQAALYNLIGRMRDSRGCGILLVSHDLHLVMAETDRVVCLDRRIRCAGTPVAVSRDPRFVDLFGPAVAGSLAAYRHDHEHDHDHGRDHGQDITGADADRAA